MFAALMVARLRQEARAAGVDDKVAWMSADEVPATELPLAKAVERVLDGMHVVLGKTKVAMDEEIKSLEGTQGWSEERIRLRRTRAAEVDVVRNVQDLRVSERMFWAKEL